MPAPVSLARNSGPRLSTALTALPREPSRALPQVPTELPSQWSMTLGSDHWSIWSSQCSLFTHSLMGLQRWCLTVFLWNAAGAVLSLGLGFDLCLTPFVLCSQFSPVHLGLIPSELWDRYPLSSLPQTPGAHFKELFACSTSCSLEPCGSSSISLP